MRLCAIALIQSVLAELRPARLILCVLCKLLAGITPKRADLGRHVKAGTGTLQRGLQRAGRVVPFTRLGCKQR